MKPPLRIAHASDIHLDTDYFGGEVNRSSCEAGRKLFSTLLEGIQGLQPSLFMLPGDLFDSNRASDETILWSMEMLAKLDFPVAMIPGNHDCLLDGGVFHRFNFAQIPDVHLLTASEGETVVLDDPPVVIWGKGMVDHTPEYKPLQGLPQPVADKWNLAMGHGIYVGKDQHNYRSSPISAHEIAESGFDYIALGHHHAMLDVSQNGTVAFYCGAPVPISTHDKGTFLLVELVEGEQPQMTIHSL